MFTVTSVPADTAEDDESSIVLDEVLDYTAMNPISIESDTALTTFATTNSLSGNGTAGNPYVISDYDIKGNNTTTPVLLSNLSLHLLVKGNRVHNVTDQEVEKGLDIVNCTNLTIQSNDIKNFTQYGIYVEESDVVVKDNNITNISIDTDHAAVGYYSSNAGSITNNTITSCARAVLLSECEGIRIDRNTINISKQGILVEESSNMTVVHNRISNNTSQSTKGIRFEDCEGGIVSFNDISTMRGSDISLDDSANFTISNNTIGHEGNPNPSNTAFYLDYSTSILIENNTVNNSNGGVIFDDCENVVIRSNYIECDATMIRGDMSVNITLADNTLRGFETDGHYSHSIIHDRCSNVTINNNTMYNSSFWFRNDWNPRDWFTISADDNNTINGTPVHFLINETNMTITKPFGQLISINCTNVTIDSVQAPYEYYGALIRNCDDIVFKDSTLPSHEISRYWIHSDNVSFINTTHSKNLFYMIGDGMLMRNCSFNNIRGVIIYMGNNSTFEDNTFGPNIQTAFSFNNYHRYWDSPQYVSRGIRVLNNTINGSYYSYTDRGIYLFYTCLEFNISGNTLENCGIEIYYDSMDHVSGYEMSSNTLDGKPILFLKDVSDKVVTGNGYGQIITANSTNITLHNITFDNAFLPFQVFQLHHSEVRDIFIRNTTDTTWESSIFYDCDNLTMVRIGYYNNTERLRIEKCVDTFIGYNDFVYRGLEIIGCERFVLHNNTLTRCWSVALIVEDSKYGNITNNWIQEGGGWGTVDLDDFYHLNVHHNTFRDCSQYAITLHHRYGGDLNTYIHHNNFIDNAFHEWTRRQLGTDGSMDAQYIDDGLEGNYWSDYNVTFPNQTHNNWTWDTPYVCRTNVFDRYPLVHPVDMDGPVAWAKREHNIDTGVTVHFDASASTVNVGMGNYSWTFIYNGTNVTLYGVKANYTFDLAGNYSVILNVTDGKGRWSLFLVKVNVWDGQSPVADAGSDIIVDQGTTVFFNATASTDNVAIIIYAWTFSYNNTTVNLFGAIANHTFDIPGVYNVSLNVSDANRNWDTVNITLTVRDTMAPTAVISGGNVEVDEGDLINMNATLSTDNVGIFNYTWSYDYNGTQFEGHNPIVVFQFWKPGNVTINLTVKDAAGNNHTTSVWVRIHDITSPVAEAGGDIFIDQGDTADFNASASSDNMGIVTFEWSFTYDGNLIELGGETNSHRFLIPGVYNVTLKVIDLEDNWAQDWLTVTVRDTVSPVSVAGDDVVVDQGTLVSFDGGASFDNMGIVSYTWNFVYSGSMTTLHGLTTDFRFHLAGIYNVTLTVADIDSNLGYDTMTVTVVDTEAPVVVTVEYYEVPTDTNLSFDASGSRDNMGITSWTWTFRYNHEDVVLRGPTPSFLFHLPGVFTITLNIADAEGNGATSVIQVTVKDMELPIIVTASEIEVDLGEPAILDASNSTDNVVIVEYSWTFRIDGKDMTVFGPVANYIFRDVGLYNVRLTLEDSSGNINSTIVVVIVRDPEGPKADAGYDFTLDQGDNAVLDGSGSTDLGGISAWDWTFEYDGETITLQGRVTDFTFDLAGEYDITLTVTDVDGNTNVDLVRVTIMDTEPPVADAGNDIDIEEGEELVLIGSASTDNVGITLWSWTIRQGIIDVVGQETGETVPMTLDIGLYDVTLRVMDAAGNEDYDTITLTVREMEAPVADAGDDTTVEAGDEHTFDGTGTTSDDAIESYTWTVHNDTGDVVLDGAEPWLTFVIPGEYLVTLTVVDTNGSSDTDTVTITVVDTTPPVSRPTIKEVDDSNRRILDGSESLDVVGVVNWTWEVVFENEITLLYGPTVDLHRRDPGDYQITLTVRDAAGNEAYEGVTITIEEDETQFSYLWLGIVAVIAAIAVVVTFVALKMMGTGKPDDLD